MMILEKKEEEKDSAEDKALTAARAPPTPRTAGEDPSERPKSRLTKQEYFL
jgi:hypothetical protein